MTLLLCAAIPLSLQAQERTCGFDQYLDSQIEKDIKLLSRLEVQETSLRKFAKSRSLASGQYNIPGVVHVLHKNEKVGVGTNISDAQIFSAIERLNDAFSGKGFYSGSDSGIKFNLAARSPFCTETSGIVRVSAQSVCVDGDCYAEKGLTAKNENAVKLLSSWPSSDYLNIWVVSEIEDNNGQGGIQAFADFPGVGVEHDGIVILYNVLGAQNETGSFNLKSSAQLGSILIHEVGHSLGLYHTFEGDDLNRDGYSDRCPSFTGCGPLKGDCLDDTPPHKRTQSNCPVDQINVCDGGTSNDLVIHNFMDYSSEDCQSEFTDDQIQRMQSMLQSARSSWTKSLAHLPLEYFQAGTSTCIPQTKILTNSFGLGIIEFQLADLSEVSGSASEDGGYVDNWCAAAQVQAGRSYSVFINTGDRNYQNVKVFCDFNADGDFGDAGEEIFASDYKKIHSGKITIPNSAKKGVPLRLRAIAGYAGFEIADACHQPYYGQVEDYSLIVGNLSMPVTIKSLKASLNGQGSLISWLARGEQHIKSYDVERSENGIHFDKIASITGKRKSYSKYQHLDSQVKAGDNFYRLRIHTVNNEVYLSEMIYLSNEKEVTNNNYTVYPNPIVGFKTRIESVGTEQVAGIRRVELLDHSGHMVALLHSGIADPTVDLSLPSIERVVYYLRITSKNGVIMKRISKL